MRPSVLVRRLARDPSAMKEVLDRISTHRRKAKGPHAIVGDNSCFAREIRTRKLKSAM